MSSVVPKTVYRSLYKKLLKSAGSLQTLLDAREEKGMKGIDKLLLRVAMRPDQFVMTTSKPVVAEFDSATCLTSRVRHRFSSTHAPVDVNHAFLCLKFSNELCQLLNQCNQPEKRGNAALNVGQIVWHRGQLCAVYGYTSEFKQRQSGKKSHQIGPYYHVVSSDGKFRYVSEYDVEVAKGCVPKYLKELRGSAADGSTFVDGLFFESFTSDRLIANSDLWKRYPDVDARTSSVGMATLPLSLDRDQHLQQSNQQQQQSNNYSSASVTGSFLTHFKLVESYHRMP